MSHLYFIRQGLIVFVVWSVCDYGLVTLIGEAPMFSEPVEYFRAAVIAMAAAWSCKCLTPTAD